MCCLRVGVTASVQNFYIQLSKKGILMRHKSNEKTDGKPLLRLLGALLAAAIETAMLSRLIVQSERQSGQETRLN